MNIKTDYETIKMNKKSFFEDLRAIKKGQKMPDGIFGSFMTRPVSHIVAYFFHKIHFTPNMVTFISFLLCLASCLSLLVFRKSDTLFVVAALTWWCGAILDAADGDLARYSNKASMFGAWFDSYLDRLKEFMIFGTLGYLGL